ncbi:hypothetical protein DAPPUDRAFT_280160, partial [Daphnia pulex]
MNASLSKSTLKFLVYRASVASLAAPSRTPEPTPRPLSLRTRTQNMLAQLVLPAEYYNHYTIYDAIEAMATMT